MRLLAPLILLVACGGGSPEPAATSSNAPEAEPTEVTRPADGEVPTPGPEPAEATWQTVCSPDGDAVGSLHLDLPDAPEGTDFQAVMPGRPEGGKRIELSGVTAWIGTDTDVRTRVADGHVDIETVEGETVVGEVKATFEDETVLHHTFEATVEPLTDGPCR